ncbi:peroxidase [Corynebacterium yudongzhengii]|uniref:Dyp-type peroxidase n=1 Tax=Corynebacterium yudongzhengii TaxID=2080740 RepID=A0A2U1T4Y3_9CORY|nr:Dyp-type peroxidase [Corynebacterium yudongzhengii]AWB81788.1 peroxidase [Corynebacterium yudongzhengii]PWC01053.1 Dyp-type peroxidase [Corynebacterium yudongzhengii]
MSEVSRRGFLVAGGTVAASAALIARGGQAPAQAAAMRRDAEEFDEHSYLAEYTVSFDGAHQAGISTPHQAHLNLVGFDFHAGASREDVQRLLKLWTSDARALCQGETPPGSLEPEMSASPANLTITCGIGPRVFEIIGEKRPGFLDPIPAFELDELEENWGQTDLVLQICGDDPTTVSHATRHMVRSSKTYVSTGWMQQGFLNAHGTSGESPTPRNLFGQLDGSVNPRGVEDFAEQVWIDDGPDWARDSTVMVVRRIRMNLDTWEELDRASRENAVGRRLDDGAPLSGGGEFDDIDLHATDDYGLPVIDRNSHAARAHPPAGHPEQRLLRRSYNYDLPPVPGDQLSNSGLVFICFQKDPHEQFVPIQKRLDERDLLNEWITHIGSAAYWIPPGVGRDRDAYWAQSLLE